MPEPLPFVPPAPNGPNMPQFPDLDNGPAVPPKADHDTLRGPAAPSEGSPLPPAAYGPATPETRQYINRPRVFLAYEVEHAANDANKIQIWLTSDDGRNWIHAGEDSDGRSPAEIRLPGEGVTGVRLLTGGQQPSTMSLDDGMVSWIELDVTK